MCKDNKPYSNKSYHEQFIIDKKYWLFFDIEVNSSMDPNTIININDILNQITTLLKGAINHNIGERFNIYHVQDNTHKQKYWIYTNLAMWLGQMKYIAQILDNPFIDW